MLSFLEIQNDVWDHLKEEKGTDEFWTEAEVRRALNDVYYDLAFDLRCFRTEFIIEVRSGVRKYKLPSDYVIGSLTVVEYDDKEIWPVAYKELSDWNRNWRSASGTPTHYILGLDSDDEIDLYPAPDTSGEVYNEVSTSEGNYGLITTIGDDSYEEFDKDRGVIVDTDENDARFEYAEGAVQDIMDPTNNLRIHYARFPKRLLNDGEIFLAPVSNNPQRILTKGALHILLEKDGEGKDIAKASYYNKRYEETKDKFKSVSRLPRTNVMKSISESSGRNAFNRGLNLGDHYPSYYMR